MKRSGNISNEVLGIRASELTGYTQDQIADMIRSVQAALAASEPRMSESEIQEAAEKIYTEANHDSL